ncbi:MAG: U32 family peptidase [Eubacterium sp.]|nr:U32 family peptidase [Eubacterium sp.]
MKSKIPELLSPAGSFEVMKSCLMAGADCVYGAGEQFGARSFATNFTDDELLDAIDLCHVLGKRFYLTVNTLFKEEELGRVMEFLAPLYERGLDGCIVQDVGAVRLMKRCFPKLPIHGSTQMSVYSSTGARLLEELGFEQVVLPRELSLDEIRRIRDEVDIKLECFIHGALCYSFSGQCLMSSMIGGRSGNRGRCAGTCRLPFEAAVEGDRIAGGYPLSLKDLCGIASLEELCDIGVDTLKIEGRVKKGAYAANVTRVYREALDMIASGGGIDADELTRVLRSFGDRSGFTNGYFDASPGGMVSFDSPSHTVEETDFIFDASEESLKLPVDIEGEFRKGAPGRVTYRCGEHSVTLETGEVTEAVKAPVTAENISDKLKKLGNTCFCPGDVRVSADDHSFVRVGELNAVRREACEALSDKMLRPFRRDDAVRAKERLARVPDASGDTGLWVSVRSFDQLGVALGNSDVDVIALDCHGFGFNLGKHAEDIRRAGKRSAYMLPVVFRQDVAEGYGSVISDIMEGGFDYVVLRAFDQLGLIREFDKPGGPRIVADAGLYSWNGESSGFYHDLGVEVCTAPYELTGRELSRRGMGDALVTVYGYCPLMTSAQCVRRNSEGRCMKGSAGEVTLTDRFKKDFRVLRNCDICVNRIYNSVPTMLFGKSDKVLGLRPYGLRMDFTFESGEEMAEILGMYHEAFVLGNEVGISGEFTYGHFMKGID